MLHVWQTADYRGLSVMCVISSFDMLKRKSTLFTLCTVQTSSFVKLIFSCFPVISDET